MSTIMVLGGGYAGLRLVQDLSVSLDKKHVVTLVDCSAHHELTTRLPKILNGEIGPSSARIPFSRLLGSNVRFLQATVEDVNVATGTVETSRGPVQSDRIVIALGSTPDFPGVRDAEGMTHTFRGISDATRLRDVLAACLEQRREVKVVVVGGGYTGTEVAGELAERAAKLRQARMGPQLEVTVVSADPRLLPEGSELLAASCQRILDGKGVTLVLGTGVVRVRPRGVLTDNHGSIDADIVVWAAHSRPVIPSRYGLWPSEKDGRIRVDPWLRMEGHDSVYVVGDAAHAYDFRRDRPVAASAQVAIQEGALAAWNIVAEVTDERTREFRPRILGEALSLGGKDAAAEVGGIVVTGRAALAVKQLALTRYLTGLGGPALAAQYL